MYNAFLICNILYAILLASRFNIGQYMIQEVCKCDNYLGKIIKIQPNNTFTVMYSEDLHICTLNSTKSYNMYDDITICKIDNICFESCYNVTHDMVIFEMIFLLLTLIMFMVSIIMTMFKWH